MMQLGMISCPLAGKAGGNLGPGLKKKQKKVSQLLILVLFHQFKICTFFLHFHQINFKYVTAFTSDHIIIYLHFPL